MEFLFSSFGKILHYKIHKKLQKYFTTPVLTPVKCVVIWSPHLILHSYSRVSNKAWHRCLNYLTHYQWRSCFSVHRVCHFAKSLRINWVSLPQILQNKYFRQIFLELKWHIFSEPAWPLLSRGVCQINQFRCFP